ncbi:Ribosome biogenesis protein bms1 [Penicillium subrubescens]|uniref:Ribosome biogenesis protein bms1 n=1 Tax=Penicillium subrubescens TaxID=1316194 RepID=UPI002545157E|nr:Ribosome biogenesis protein bms1 [Penicillium subrubescens]KAJ5905697.1 Ribosome biogenesis protein bms1 [Penicillium subrubescens]
MEQQSNRTHRPAKEKKKFEGSNPKAFAYSNPGKLNRQAARSHDVKEKRLHVPQVDRMPEEAPPTVVAIVGPSGVSSNVQPDVQSRIAILTSTLFFKSTGRQDNTSQIFDPSVYQADLELTARPAYCAKIADIVLLMIDGNYGFEMETMEFLNALSTSGMPGNVFGILTHLDLFKKQSTLRMTKKRLKHRFWSELYQGAKLFYLSGVINGRYPDREVHNLSRFLSVMKNPRPLIWRNSHPYALADRFLDITPPTQIEENPKCDRTVALYGYLRGTNFPAQGARVHVPGVGDLTVSGIEGLPDPCPTPYMDQQIAKATGKSSRRKLGEKQKLLFAPMSDVGGVLVDKDAVYIDIKTNTFDRDSDEESDDENRGLGEQLVVGLQGERRLLGEADEGIRLFRGGEKIAQGDEAEETGRKHKRQARIADGERVTELNSDDEEGLDSDEDDEELGDDQDEDDDFSGDEEDEIDVSAPADFESSFKERQNGKSNGEDGDVAFADSDSDLGSISSVEDQELDSGDEDEEDDGEEGEDDEDDEGNARWKDNMLANAKALHGKRPAFRVNDLSRMIYDESITPIDVVQLWRGEADDEDEEESDIEADEDGEDFFKKTDNEKRDQADFRAVPEYDYEELERKWRDEELIESLRRRFVTAKLGGGGSDDDLEEGDLDDLDSDDEGDGAFEDLETGEVFDGFDDDEDKDGDEDEDEGDEKEPEGPVDLDAERERNAKRKEELKLRFEEEDREGFANAKDGNRDGLEGEFGEDDWYDLQKAKMQKQLDINRAEFDELDPASRARAEGYKAGTYARIVLENVPYEFASKFNPRFPVIVGGLAPTEDRFGYVQIRIKRHRWHKKILKSNDPLIFSLGWRRFQSLPIYSTSDSRTRNRMLKYTPEHMHCFGVFYGPLVAPNTGFCCVQSFSNKTPGFRIAATGVVLSVDEHTEIVKKLKLTGVPYKIFKNTAFIKDMFNSSLEIAKFEGASIKTVSGIRGQIKRALSKPEGYFRATFEDKILMSDIVFLRAWYPIKPHRFYNPVTNLLDQEEGGTADSGWQGMRLTGEVRRDQGIPTPMNKDSAYRKIERQERHFNPLRVPKQLAAELPFKSQITKMKKHTDKTYMQKRAVVLGGEEKKARDLMQKLTTMRNEKSAKRAAKQEERRKVYRAKVADSLEKKTAREKRERNDYWRREGKKRKNDDESGGGRGKKRG